MPITITRKPSDAVSRGPQILVFDIETTPMTAYVWGCFKQYINPSQLITTSEIRITCIIDEDRVKDAVRALHQTFELETGE